MARTNLTVNTLSRSGASLVTEAADTVNGNAAAVTSNTLMSFFSTTGGTVTISNPNYMDGSSTDGLKCPNRVLTLSPATVFLWVCPAGYYVQADGTVWLDFAQATSVALYRI